MTSVGSTSAPPGVRSDREIANIDHEMPQNSHSSTTSPHGSRARPKQAGVYAVRPSTAVLMPQYVTRQLQSSPPIRITALADAETVPGLFYKPARAVTRPGTSRSTAARRSQAHHTTETQRRDFEQYRAIAERPDQAQLGKALNELGRLTQRVT